MKQLITLLFILVSGNQLTAQQNTLPEKRPAGFTLSYNFHGGMYYHIEDITISADSCIYKNNLHGNIMVHRFKLSEADLDSLYAILQQNQFTQIVYGSNGFVHDRGGITITIGWDNNRKQYKVNDSESNFVAKEWKSKWGRICDYVKKLALN
jgi:hypothetical protein